MWDNYLVSCGYDRIVKIWKLDSTLYADFHNAGQFALNVPSRYSVIISASKESFFHVIKGPVPWGVLKCLWLAVIKNDPQECGLAILPKDIIKVVISFLGSRNGTVLTP